jgi:hypothetical protein
MFYSSLRTLDTSVIKLTITNIWTNKIFICVVSISIVCWLILGDVQSACGQTDAISEAIDKIKKAENQFIAEVGVVQWSSKHLVGKYTNVSLDDPGSSIQLTGMENSGLLHAVELDTKSGNYRCTFSGVINWIDGPKEKFTIREIYAFDGTSAKRYTVGEEGAVSAIPDGAIGSGLIRPSLSEEFLKTHGVQSGVAFFPPFFFGKRLTQYLEYKCSHSEKVEIKVKGPKVEIVTSPPDGYGYPPIGSDCHIIYDFALKGITQVSFIGNNDAIVKDLIGKTWMRYDIMWSKISSRGIETILPTMIVSSTLTGNNANQFILEKFEIRLPQGPSRFDIVFPIGTRLTDEINKKIYVVSKGIVNEQEATRQFMQAHGLIYSPKDELRSSPKYSRRRAFYLTSSIASVALLLTIIAVRRFRRIRRLSGLLVALALSSSRIMAQSLDSQGTWYITSPSGWRTSVTQCGFNAVLFALEYYKTPYSLRNVSVSLPPDEFGVRMSDIRDVLLSHGLVVCARDGVSLDELCHALQPGAVALFPVKLNRDFNHYYLAVNHRTKGILLIDPPKSVLPLKEAMNQDLFSSLGGLVLFISKPRQATKLSEGIVVEPAAIDLGEFPSDYKYNKPVKRRIQLQNTNNHPISLSSILSPCGCISIQSDRLLIPAHSHIDVDITILMGSWGWGYSSRTVTFQFPDGSSKDLSISAIAHSPRFESEFNIEPRTIRIVPLPSQDRSTIRINYNGKLEYKITDIVCTSDKPWLTVGVPTETVNGVEIRLLVNESCMPTNVVLPLYANVSLTDPTGRKIGEVSVIYDN